MEAIQRQQHILDQLKKHQTIRIADISQDLNISRETIRKDVYLLDKKGLVQAIRGGATLPQSISATQYGQRQQLAVQEKIQIADKALSLIHDNDSIFLDYGTTAFQVAEAIKHSNLQNLTVITNSTFVMSSLQFVKDIQIVLLGGTMRTSEGSLAGPLTLSNITSLFANIGFFGCGGVSIENGITNHYIEEVEVSKKMMGHCQKIIGLADSSKFNRNALYKTANINELDALISDHKLSQDRIDQIKIAGTELLIG